MDEILSGVQKYLNTISSYDNEFKAWEARAKKIIKRYRDDNRNSGNSGSDTAKFNILWSNIQTLIPAVYARMPKADVMRRFGDNDQVGRVASQLVERALDFEIEHYPDFRSSMRRAVEDRFLGGRGVAWVRYEPHVIAQDEPPDGVQVSEDSDEAPQEAIEYECAPTDYVYWKDFGHNVARTWEEVTIVWRWVYMTREALIERFGDKGKKIPLDAGPIPSTRGNSSMQEHTRARICELWDKDDGRVYWLSKSAGEVLDERDDPLELEGFFPCARPLYATTTSDTLVPVPDFALYQDQANELDILSDRIDGLVKSLRVRGVYDASQPALQRLLTEGENNALIPVDKWMQFAEKNGLKGSIDLLPLDTLASALLQCYQARADIKGQIYEITGIADIIRGQSAASETATAQQIKGQYAGLRLRAMQEDVAMFASELLRLKAQVICTKFQPQTILAYAAAQQMNPADQQLIPQAIALLKDKPLRNFRIEVAADSLVQIDEQQAKQERMEFLTAFSSLLQQAIPAAQASPEMIPVLGELMKFGIGAFKQARSIEGALDAALEQFKNAPQQGEKPDPEMMKIQAQQQMDQTRMQSATQAAQTKAQMDLQIEQMKVQSSAQLEAQKQQHETQMEAQKLAQQEQFDRWKAELDAATKVMVARIGANPGLDLPLIEAQQAASERITAELGGHVTNAINRMADMQQSMATMQDQTSQNIGNVMQILAAPKRVVRDAAGKIAEIRSA